MKLFLNYFNKTDCWDITWQIYVVMTMIIVTLLWIKYQMNLRRLQNEYQKDQSISLKQLWNDRLTSTPLNINIVNIIEKELTVCERESEWFSRIQSHMALQLIATY